MKSPKTHYTDVLVVGGGGAATAAALAAHEAGASTMMVIKGRFGVPGVRGAGATSNPVGDFWTIRTIGPKGGFFNPPEAILADMLQTGLGMADPELCQIFVEEAPSAISRLRTMGMQFQSRMLATMPANEDNKTNNIVAIQKAIIEQTQTRVLEAANLTDLIVDDGICHGAVGVMDDGGEPFIIRCGAVILATSGVGQLFKYSFNPPGNTGDGYAMALRAGAELTNMEFMQQGLATTWPAQGIVMLYEMQEPYRLLNHKGKAFLQEYLPDGVGIDEVCQQKSSHWPVSCRDHSIHLDRAIKAQGINSDGFGNGQHAPVFLDLSRAERKFLPELFPAFMLEKGIDINQDLLQVQNHHHTSNGGVRIDTSGQSSINGLFAVGEASAWQGADRLGGTMLGGSQVFGWRAGSAAAEVARNAGQDTSLQAAIDSVLEPIYRTAETKGTDNVVDAHRDLQVTMWETLIVEKDADSLRRAQQCVDQIQEQLNTRIGILQPTDHAAIAELRNMLCVAGIIIAAASMRTESRGSHYRSDYPQRDDTNWLTNIIVSYRQSRIDCRKQWISEPFGWEDQPGDIRISPWG
jgi:succinate dehydrogenase/fumarate reductase flavoprotein subunit